MEGEIDIKQIDRWILWKRTAEGVKLPCNQWGQVDSAMNPLIWLPHDVANAALALRRNFLAGVGFVFSGAEPLIGVDLDCSTDGFVVRDWALSIHQRLEKTYCEVSPSNQGIKYWGIGRRPPGAMNSVRLPDGAGGIECYESGRWFAWTGRHFGTVPQPIVDIQDEINWLYATYFQQRVAKLAAPASPTSQAVPFNGFESRIAGYVSAIRSKPIVKGERNTRLFSLACGLHGFEHDGEILTDDQVHEIVSKVNGELAEPLGQEEVDKLCQSASRSGRGAGSINPKLNRKIADSIELDVDLSELLKFRLHIDSAESSIDRQIEREFPSECTAAPGFIGRFVAEIQGSAMYQQPQIALGAALSLLAVITGRKIEDRVGTRTNIYLVNVAPTGSGKEHFRSCIFRVLEDAGGSAMIGQERIASNAGLVGKLVSSPASLWCLDEIGRMLEAIKGAGGRAAHLHSIISVLLQLYSSANRTWRGDAYADVTRNPEIDQPHLVIFGSSTAEAFWESLDARSLQDGFIGRLGPLFGDYTHRNHDAGKYLPSAEVVHFVRSWVEFGATGGNLESVHPEVVTILRSEDAEERWATHIDAINARRTSESRDSAAIWSRAGERAAKFAMLFAVSRGMELGIQVPAIELEDMDRAIALSNWMARSMLREYSQNSASNQTEAIFNRVAKIIRESGAEGIPRWMISKKCRYVSRGKRDEIVADLIESRQCEFRETKGGTGKVYWVD